MSAPLVRVRCPGCRAEYAFPQGLMGAYGARVACPACDERFLVPPAAAVAAPGPAPSVSRRADEAPRSEPVAPAARPPAEAPRSEPVAPAARPPAEAPRSRPPRDRAEASLASLEPHRDRVRRAAKAGRLLAEFGPALLDAFDDYARAEGAAASRAAFARAVRERLGVTLPIGDERRRYGPGDGAG